MSNELQIKWHFHLQQECKIVGSKPIHCVHNLPIKNKRKKEKNI